MQIQLQAGMSPEQLEQIIQAKMIQDILPNEYAPITLDLTLLCPIRFPNGWRFVCHREIDNVRVGSDEVILFVHTPAGQPGADQIALVEEEWKLIQSPVGRLSGPPAARALSLQDALKKVAEQNPDAVIETTERIWNYPMGETPGLGWEIGILKPSGRQVIRIAPADGDRLYVEQMERPKLNLVSPHGDWSLSGMHCTDESLVITFDQSQRRFKTRNYLTVWSCMAHVSEFLENLGYGGIDLQKVEIEYTNRVSTPELTMDRPKSRATISFPEQGLWSQDISVVLHELAHAVWELSYARPPMGIDAGADEIELKGLQEGFADYLAATQIAGAVASLARHGQEPAVRIGEVLDLAPGMALDLRLPRDIDGQPVEISAAETLIKHIIGKRWANCLWDLRRRIGAAQADALILLAHLKPPRDDASMAAPQKPLPWYFAALRATAAFIPQLYGQLDWQRLATVDWDDLQQRHHIA